MSTIRVERQLDGPIEGIFEILSDHENYDRFGGVRHAELLRPGDSERNGRGAMRRIKLGPLVFDEEITAFERPIRMDYVIRKLNVPFDHDGGSIRLDERDGGTHALWTSTFRIPVALIGGPSEAAIKLALGNGFARLLRVSAKRANELEPAPA
jgi:uncharacterized protein YndB with AHSA1/START domain